MADVPWDSSGFLIDVGVGEVERSGRGDVLVERVVAGYT